MRILSRYPLSTIPRSSIIILSPESGASILRDTILASSLPLLKSITRLDIDQLSPAKVSSFQSERILCPDPSLGLTSDMFTFDVKDCLKNMTGEETFAEISGLSTILGSLGRKYGKYKCSEKDCQLRSIDTSDLSGVILKEAESYKGEELILFLSEDFHYKIEGSLSNSDYLVWRLKEEISLGASRFLYDRSLFKVKDDYLLRDLEFCLPNDVKNRSLGLILRTIKLGNLSQEDLEEKIKEALGEGRSRNATSLNAYLFLKNTEGREQEVQPQYFEKDPHYDFISSFSLDADFLCSACNKSFKYPDKDLINEDRSLEVVSSGDNEKNKSEKKLPVLYLGSLPLYRYTENLDYLFDYISSEYGSEGFTREDIGLIESLKAINVSDISLSLLFKELNIKEKLFLYLHSLVQNKVTDYIYIKDFPELSLSPSDKESLNYLLLKLREMGNTLILVDYEGNVGEDLGSLENVLSWNLNDGMLEESKVLSSKNLSIKSKLCRTKDKDKDKFDSQNNIIKPSSKEEVLDNLRRGGLFGVKSLEGSNRKPSSSFISDSFKVLSEEEGWLCFGLKVERSSISIRLYSDITRSTLRKFFKGKKREVTLAEESLIDVFQIREEVNSLLSTSARGRALGLSSDAYSKGGQFACRTCEGRGCFRDPHPLGYSILHRCSRCKGTGVDLSASEHQYLDKSPHELLSLSPSQARNIFDFEDPSFDILSFMDNDLVKNIPLNIRICELSNAERVVIGLLCLHQLILPALNGATAVESQRHAILLEWPFASMNMKELKNVFSSIKDIGLLTKVEPVNMLLGHIQLTDVPNGRSCRDIKDIKICQNVLIS